MEQREGADLPIVGAHCGEGGGFGALELAQRVQGAPDVERDDGFVGRAALGFAPGLEGVGVAPGGEVGVAVAVGLLGARAGAGREGGGDEDGQSDQSGRRQHPTGADGEAAPGGELQQRAADEQREGGGGEPLVLLSRGGAAFAAGSGASDRGEVGREAAERAGGVDAQVASAASGGDRLERGLLETRDHWAAGAGVDAVLVLGAAGGGNGRAELGADAGGEHARAVFGGGAGGSSGLALVGLAVADDDDCALCGVGPLEQIERCFDGRGDVGAGRDQGLAGLQRAEHGQGASVIEGEREADKRLAGENYEADTEGALGVDQAADFRKGGGEAAGGDVGCGHAQGDIEGDHDAERRLFER